jgi:phosphoketolase
VAIEGALPPADAPPAEGPLSPDLLDKMQRYWQATNYLTIGQIYLPRKPLLREPLRVDQISCAGGTTSPSVHK